MKPKDITITITVNDRNYNLEGIPESAFKAFVQNTKKHFPDAGEDAWASALTEVILSFTTHEAYFMTDIPKENSVALEKILGLVGWSFDQFHAYLLHAAVKKDALRIISFHEDDPDKQNLGTIILTGLRKSVFESIESALNVPVESFMGILFHAINKGNITFTPESVFEEASRSKRNINSTES